MFINQQAFKDGFAFHDSFWDEAIETEFDIWTKHDIPPADNWDWLRMYCAM